MICDTCCPNRPWPTMITLACEANAGSSSCAAPLGFCAASLPAIIIRKGVEAIDSVTTAPNRLAASGSINNACCAAVNNTNANSPPWLNSMAMMMDGLLLNPKNRPSAKMMAILTATNASASPATNKGCARMTSTSSNMPTARKNRPSRIDRNGSISASSSCRYGDSASMTPATNAPNAGDTPIDCMTAALTQTVNSPVTMNSSRSEILPTSRNNGDSK